MTDAWLSRLFDYTDADLAANRAGRLSERQRGRLHGQAQQAAAGQVATITTIPLVLLLVALCFALIPPLGDTLQAGICVVVLAAIAGIYIVAQGWWRVANTLMLWLLRRPTAADWLRRRLPSYARAHALIELGDVHAQHGVASTRSDGEHEYLFLGQLELQSSVDAVPDERLKQLATDQAYAVYFVRDTDWIVAVEALAAGEGEALQ